MFFDNIQFPIEGIVQKQVHFSDINHNYVFSFTSPYIYEEPKKYKDMNAFLIGKYNPFNQNHQSPEEIYAYFIIDPKRDDCLNKRYNLKKQMIDLYSGDNEKIGSIGVFFPKHRFLGFSTKIPHVLYNKTGDPVGFSLYQPKLRRKSIFSFRDVPEFLKTEISDDTILELEQKGEIKRHFTYELVQRETDWKKKLETYFSAEKKAENILNQIIMNQKPENEEQFLLMLTGIIAFFWTTVIEYPLNEN